MREARVVGVEAAGVATTAFGFFSTLCVVEGTLVFFLLSAALERNASDRQTDGFVHFVLNFLVDSDSPVTPSTKSDVYNLY